MKIAIDGYDVGTLATGVGRVVHNVLVHLLDLRKEDEFHIFTREKLPEYQGIRIEQVVLPDRGGYLRWQNGPLRKALKRLPPDLLFAPNYILPVRCEWKSLLIEHDISAVSHPEWYSRKYALTRKYLIARSLKKSSRVVVPSEFIKKEIISRFRINPEKLNVIGWGIKDTFKRRPPEEVDKWAERKGLKDRVVIGYLGSIFNRRNIPLLVRAVELLRKEVPDLSLYIVGRDLTHPAQPLERLLNEGWIKWEASLSEQELPLFYSSLRAFAYLSTYEGFGFPPLEALACGAVPVLLNMSSLAEVFTGMAVMVEMLDEDEIKEALRKALTEARIRKDILDTFARRREEFSWMRAAREFSLLMDDVLKETQ